MFKIVCFATTGRAKKLKNPRFYFSIGFWMAVKIAPNCNTVINLHEHYYPYFISLINLFLDNKKPLFKSTGASEVLFI